MNTQERGEFLRALFARTRELAPEDQEHLVRAECQDVKLRAELMSLLEAYRQAPRPDFANPILPENVVIDGYEADWEDTVPADGMVTLGESIGPYKILQELGEGGMGTVYMAEQIEPVSRRVALKLIKRGMSSREVLARFEAERQALSMMDHPNIARVLDAGAEAGRPYFVMELVKGLPITDYCDTHRLDAKRRLELFTAVCRGVAHAHQKGIIHRDIKPSNVLVAEYDDNVVPKIIDFGVAKATTLKLTEKTLFTQYGQLVGTVEYMSPEQAKLNQLDIDTRSDVYSLGVLLYELLVGTTPFDKKRLRSAALHEMLRIISEEDPPKLSTRLTSQDSAVEVAARRSIRPDALTRMLSGELDWIVMRSLEKDRKRRYQSAGEFADDVQRHLTGDAVIACPPTLRYRMGKFVRRHKAPFSVACLVLVLLSTSSVVGWSLYRQTDIARKAESSAREDAVARLRESTATRLAAQSQSLFRKAPVVSTLLAIEAVETTRRNGEAVLPIARDALMTSTSVLGGVPLVGHTDRVSTISTTPSGRWVVTSSHLGPRVWDLSSTTGRIPSRRLPHLKAGNATISPDERWILTGASDGSVRLWSFNSGNLSKSFQELAKHDIWTTNVIITDDSRWAIVSFHDGLVNVWDLTAADPKSSMRSFMQHTEKEFRGVVDVSVDGRWLVTGSRIGTASVWDLRAHDQTMPHHEFNLEDPIARVSISADSRWMLTVSDRPRLWDLSADDPSSTAIPLRMPGTKVGGSVMTRDSRLLAIAGQDGTVTLYDLEVGPTEYMIMRGHPGEVSSVTISEDAEHRWLVTAGDDGNVRLWNLTSIDTDSLPDLQNREGHSVKLWSVDNNPESTYLLRGHDSYIDAPTITPDNKRLLTSDWNGNVRLWNLGADNPAANREVMAPDAQCLGISPDGKWLVVGSRGDDSRLWKVDGSGRLTSAIKLAGAPEGIGSLAISSDSRWLITTSELPVFANENRFGSGERVARVWDLKADNPGQQAFQLSGHQGGITALAVSEGNLVATGSADHSVRIWDLSKGRGELVQELAGHDDMVCSVAITPDGTRLASGAMGATTFVWDLTKDPVPKQPLQGHEVCAMKVAISPNGRWVVTGGGKDPSYIWDLTSLGSPKRRNIPEHRLTNSFVTGLAFSRDNKWLATGSWDNKTLVWDLSRDDPFTSPFRRIQHESGIQSVAFSHDGRRLISGSSVVPHVLDLTTEGQDPVPLPDRNNVAVAIAPDGRRAVTTDGQVVRLWDLDFEAQLEYARRLVGRELTDEERTRYLVEVDVDSPKLPGN